VSGAAECVVDASALLALLNGETGASEVAERISSSTISAVNWCETYGKLRRAGVDGDELVSGLADTGITIAPFDADDARIAGELDAIGKEAGLSLADRACLALARRLSVPALTADRAWMTVDVGVEIVCIR
jgi:ribonuclease VapC